MKKLIYTLTMLLLSNFAAMAQPAAAYQFEATTGTYTALDPASETILWSGTFDDHVQTIAIPAFPVNNAVYTSMTVSSNGFITIGGAVPTANTYSPIAISTAYHAAVSPFGVRLANAASGAPKVSFNTNAGGEIVVQWQDVKRQQYAGVEVLNFQIRLNPSNGVIRFVYGGFSTAFTSVSYKGQVGLRGLNNNDFNNRTITTGNNWTSTSPGTLNNHSCQVTTTVFPPVGLTFSWTPPAPCELPVSQPTNLTLTPHSTSQINGSFTAAAGSDSYLVVRSLSPSLTQTPVNGTTYATGNTLGNGTVVYSGINSTFNATGLANGTQYYFFVFSMNSQCAAGPLYLTENPLSGNAHSIPNGPSGFTATTAGPDQINLSVNSPHHVLVLWNTTNTFGTPSGSYSPGDPVSGGGTVHYTGPVAGLGSHTGLDPGKTYYYRCWAFTGTTYSTASSVANAITTALVPFFDGFETGNSPNAAVADWTQAGTGNSWAARKNVTSNNQDPRTGEWSASMQGNSNRWLFKRFGLIGGQTYYFSVYGRRNDIPTANVTLMAGFGSTATPAGMTQTIVGETPLTEGDYQLIEGYFMPTSSADYFLGIKGLSGPTSSVFLTIDDITLTTSAACTPPTMIKTTSVSALTVDLNWNQFGSASLWNLKYGPPGFDPGLEGSLISNISTKPYTLTGLSPNTFYEVYMQADCGGGTLSAWSSPLKFRTACLPLALPFTENFNSAAPPHMPDCWYIYRDLAGAKIETVSTQSPHSEPYHVRFDNIGYTTLNLMLISSEIDAAMQDVVLRFWAKGAANNYVLQVGTAAGNLSTFTLVEPVTLTNTYAEYTVYFTLYAGSDNRIAFRHGLGGGTRIIYLDDITIEMIATEPEIAIAPESWDFGEVSLLGSVNQNFTITNTAGGTLIIDPAITLGGPDAADFVLIDNNTYPLNLPGGQSAVVNVAFSPLTPGAKTAQLTVVDNLGSKSINTIPLSGIAYDPTITSFPYLMDFGNAWTGTPEAPKDWIAYREAASGGWTRFTGNYRSAPAAARSVRNTPNNNYLITPAIALPDYPLKLSWWDWVGSSSNINKYKVLLSTGGNSISDFNVELGDYTCTNTSWMQRFIDLGSYQNQTVYLAFYNYENTSSSFSFLIDDVMLEYTPGAAALVFPYDEMLTLTTNCRLQWAAPVSSMPILGYKVYLDNNPDPSTLVYNGTETFFEAGTLGHNSTYYWKVVPYNANGDAINMPVWSFSTVTATQLAESFDDDWFPPAGWSMDVYQWYQSPHYSFHGNRSALRATSTQQAKLHTPKLIIESNSKLRFFARLAVIYRPAQYMQVYYSTDKTTWLALGDEFMINSTSWNQFVIDLSPLAGNTYYLALGAYYKAGSEWNNVLVDHVTGPEIFPVLPEPANNPNPADEDTWIGVNHEFRWQPGLNGGVPAGYKIFMGTDGGGATTPVNIANGTLVYGTGFTPPGPLDYNTTYYWQAVPTNTAGDASPCPIWSFSTAPAGGVQIGRNDDGFENIPIDPYYEYNYSQTIYLQPEINMSGKAISKLYYYWNGDGAGTNCKDWAVYLGHTGKSFFTGYSDWIPISQLIKVFDSEVLIPATPGWVEIVLETSFMYNNTDNLVVAIHEKTPGYTDNGYFYASDMETARTITFYDDFINPDPSNPPLAEYLEDGIANIRLQLETAEPSLSTTPAEAAFGISQLYVTSEPLSLTLINTGGGVLSINSLAISGPDASLFSITGSITYPIQLASFETTTLNLVFHPSSLGLKTAVLEIANNTGGGSVHYVPITGTGYMPPIDDPEAFTATGTGLDKILLEWQKNPDLDDVMIAYNTVNEFGIPLYGDVFAVNDVLPGGGTIIYKGNLTQFTHAGLNPATRYYYRAWSVDGTSNYSIGISDFSETFCLPYSMPLFEDFNSTPSGAIPECWKAITDPATRIEVNDGVLEFFSGNNTLPTMIFVSPELIPDINNLSIRFNANLPLRGRWEVGLTIGVMDNPTDPGSFTPLQNIAPGFNWTTHKYYFHQYNGNAKHIAIKAHFNFPAFVVMAIDNVLIDYLPSCIEPTNLEAGNIGHTTAELGWTPGHLENEWQIVYGPRNFNPDTEGIIIGEIFTPLYSLDQLSAGTQYDVYVRAYCGVGDVSEWDGPVSIETLCEPIPAPIFEDFDSTPVDELPLCWAAIIGEYPEYRMVQTTDSESNSGSHSLLMSYWYLSDQGIYLVSPPLYDDISDLYVKFFAKQSGMNTPLQLGTMGSPSDASTFNHLQTIYITNSWQQYTFSLDTYAGSDAYIAFKIDNYASIYLDDILIDLISPCPRPTNLMVPGTTATTAQLAWFPGGDETMWDMIYGPPGFLFDGGGELISSIASNTYVLGGLSAGNTYQYYVRASCGSGIYSSWSWPRNFKTQPCDQEDKCAYTVQLSDSYGDGWDGTVLGFKQDGIIMTTFGEGFTNGFHFGPVEVLLCPGFETQIVVVELGGWTQEKGFTLYAPDGTLLFTWEHGTTFTEETVFHTFTSGCEPLEPEVPDFLEISNETVGGGQEICFNAKQTITVAGNGSTFVVNSGGSATLIAGQNIIMLPGTMVHHGGNLHAWITTDETYCVNPLPVVAQSDGNEEDAQTIDQPEMPQQRHSLHVYPNPTTGTFMLELSDTGGQQTLIIEVYSIIGERLFRAELPAETHYTLDLTGRQPGIYIVRVIRGQKMDFVKIVKH
jgi:hypothetical protein